MKTALWYFSHANAVFHFIFSILKCLISKKVTFKSHLGKFQLLFIYLAAHPVLKDQVCRWCLGFSGI